MAAHVNWSVLSGTASVSRRAMIKLAAGAAIGFTPLLTACGGGEAGEPPAAEGTTGATDSTSDATATSGSDAGTTEAKQGGTLRVALHLQQVLSLDPQVVNFGTVAGQLLPSLFSGLVQFDEQLNIIPDLAETYEVSDDGTSYIFHLREGLKFHNGNPLVAEDVVYTYERVTNPDLASPHANKLELVTSIQAVDELTVEITLSQPFAPFLGVACSRGPGRALTPVPKSAVEEMGDEQFGLTPVGTGPFKIVAEGADLSSRFEMVAFEDWHGGRPLLDKIVVTMIPENSSRISALEAGDIDLISQLPVSGYEQVKENDQFTIVEAPGTNWQGLPLNFNRPPWDNPDARMAIAKGINREEFNEKAFFGLMVPSVNAIAPAFGWVYRAPGEVNDPQAYNLEEAKQLAEKAGLTGLKPVMLGEADAPRQYEVLRNMLSEIGLDVQVEPAQTAVWNERWLAGDWDMMVNGSIADVDPDDGHWNFFHSTGPWNTGGYSNPEVDRLLEETRATVDQEKRKELWWQVAEKASEDVGFVFLYHMPDRLAFYTYVKGYTAVPEQRYYEKVWLDK